MALLRRGSSHISEDNFNSRLVREKAKTGAITASLAWNDPSDLDLHASVSLAAGGVHVIKYNNKQAAGGFLDVDMHARDGELTDEPVENIFWKSPPAGVYSIKVHLYKQRGQRAAAQEGVPFRALLKREGEEDLSREGIVYFASNSKNGAKAIEVFRFTVDEDGNVTMGKVSSLAPKKVTAMKVMKAPKPIMKVMKVMKSSKVATGKKAKLQVWKGQKVKTSGGLKKDDLVKSKTGKIVSKKVSEKNKHSKWSKATKQAYQVKGYSGFKAIKKGTSFYEKAKEMMGNM